jgi:hypothetical protein
MAEPLRHRQTKEAETDMFYLTPPRHISTLPFASLGPRADHFRSSLHGEHAIPVALSEAHMCPRGPTCPRRSAQEFLGIHGVQMIDAGHGFSGCAGGSFGVLLG